MKIEDIIIAEIGKSEYPEKMYVLLYEGMGHPPYCEIMYDVCNDKKELAYKYNNNPCKIYGAVAVRVPMIYAGTVGEWHADIINDVEDYLIASGHGENWEDMLGTNHLRFVK